MLLYNFLGLEDVRKIAYKLVPIRSIRMYDLRYWNRSKVNLFLSTKVGTSNCSLVTWNLPTTIINGCDETHDDKIKVQGCHGCFAKSHLHYGRNDLCESLARFRVVRRVRTNKLRNCMCQSMVGNWMTKDHVTLLATLAK